mgnify:FL=1
MSKTPTIYFIRHDKYTKIDYTTDIKGRIKDYNSQGNQIDLIIALPVEDKEIDGILKSTLYELQYNVKLPNNASTEIYDLTPKQVNALIEHLTKYKTIAKSDIIRLLNTPEIFTRRFTIESFLREFGLHYTHFEHQRDKDQSHVSNIREYIEKNYLSHTFHLGAIYAVKVADKKYVIIDGMHRIEAMRQITPNHPAIKNTLIFVEQNEALHNEADCIHAFQTRNKNKQIDGIFIKDSYMDDMHNYIYQQLLARYKTEDAKGRTVKYYHISNTVVNKNMHHIIDLDYIKKFITKDQIYALKQHGYIANYEKQDILCLVDQINNMILDFIKSTYDDWETPFDYRYVDYDLEDETKIVDFAISISCKKYARSTIRKVWKAIFESEQERLNTLRAWVAKKSQINMQKFGYPPCVLGLLPKGENIRLIYQNLSEYWKQYEEQNDQQNKSPNEQEEGKE